VKLIIDRFVFIIESENNQDIAYIEDTLGLLKNGDAIRLIRCASADGSIILETDVCMDDKDSFYSETDEEVTDPGIAVVEPVDIQVARADVVSQFKDFCEGNKLENEVSRNGGETLVDIQALDV
jgi:hypothetical protein